MIVALLREFMHLLKYIVCSFLGGIEPQTNLAFIPHQIKDYGVGIPAELVKQTLIRAKKASFLMLLC